MANEPKKMVEVVDRPAPTAPEKPTRDELKQAGWTDQEQESAVKRGLAVDKPVDKTEPETPPAPVEEPADKTAPPKPAARTGPAEFNPTPEQEEAFQKIFGPGTPPNGIFLHLKKERKARQAAEQKARESEARIQALEAQLKAPPAPPATADGADPDEQPLTLKALKKLEEEKAQKAAETRAADQANHAKIKTAQQEQETDARERYEDFDHSIERATDLMARLDELVPDKKKQALILTRIRDLQVAAAYADQLGLEDLNASDIAYEIGRQHPEYGTPKPANPKLTNTGPTKESPMANGGLTPEKLKRIEQNTQRRSSSASVPGGGGKRVVAPEDVTAEMLAGMDYKRRAAFRENHPDQYAALIRG